MLQLIMGVNTSWEGRIGLSYRIGEGNLGALVIIYLNKILSIF